MVVSDALPTPTIPHYLRALVEEFADREAVVLGHQRLTYADLDHESRRIARGLLGHGLEKGARVGLWLGNGPRWVATWLGIARVGGVAVPMTTFARGRELRRLVTHADLAGIAMQATHFGQDQVTLLEDALPGLSASRPELALTAAPFLRWVACVDAETSVPAWARDEQWLTDAPAVDDDLVDAAEEQVFADEIAMMIYTSGSTSEPKGVMHSHANVVEKSRHLHHQLDFRRDDRCLTILPFFWVGGLSMSLLPTLHAGATQVCTDDLSAPALLDTLESERVTRAGFFPEKVDAIRAELARSPRDLSMLRVGPAALLDRPGPDVSESRDGLTMGLGMSETLGCYWWGRFHDGSVGMRDANGARRTPPLHELQPGVELRVADDTGRSVEPGGLGEVQIRGACVAPRIHKQPRAASFTDDGFLRTGDSAEIRDGIVVFRGRNKELIKTSSANVAPAEVTVALMAVDGVAAAHVVGVPDHVRGELVAAAVVADPGCTLDPDSIRAELRRELSAFKVPRHIVVLERAEIPWNPATDKVRTGELIALLVDRIGVATQPTA